MMDLKCEHSPETKPLVCKCTTKELESLRQRIARLEKALEKISFTLCMIDNDHGRIAKEALSEGQGD